MGVPLGCRDPGVTETLLNDADVYTLSNTGNRQCSGYVEWCWPGCCGGRYSSGLVNAFPG